MKRFVILPFIAILIFSSISKATDYKKLKDISLEFTQTLINAPENFVNILKNSREVKSDLVLENKSSKYNIIKYKEIIKSQNRSDFRFNEFIFSRYNYKDSSMLTIRYTKNNSIFYNIFYSWLTDGCSDNVYYNFSINEDKLYFRGVFICDHMAPSDLEK